MQGEKKKEALCVIASGSAASPLDGQGSIGYECHISQKAFCPVEISPRVDGIPRQNQQGAVKMRIPFQESELSCWVRRPRNVGHY